MYTAVFWGVIGSLAVVVPLAWKWQLGIQRVTLFVATVSAVVGAINVFLYMDYGIPVHAVAIAGITLGISAAFLAYRFYRDPERTEPLIPRSILSPADGIVVYVKHSVNGELPVSAKKGRDLTLTELLKTDFYVSDATVVGISMSLLDVHVNRSPIAGIVTVSKHSSGLFGSLRDPERIFDNERNTTVISGETLQIAVVQIASRLVRQIVSYVNVGDQLVPGQRIGAIRLGSQVDVIVPAHKGISISVKPGDRVRAGQSILGRF